jgi:DNA-binding MarR family transcriptional regulator
MKAKRRANGTGRAAGSARISYRLTMISTRFARFVAPLYADRHSLSRPAWRTLAYISRHQPLSAKDVGERIAVDPAMITRAIALLVEHGLVSRETDPADQRRVILRTTRRGNEVFRDITSLITKFDNVLLETLTASERACLEGILDKLEARIEERFAGAVAEERAPKRRRRVTRAPRAAAD